MTKAITQDSDAHQPTERQRPQQKKRPLIRRIFKCFGLGLLALLIMAALIFQAPWKVITLLLIILVACTILPKWARKWFWLSAGTTVIALIIWVFLPEDNEGWRPYTFDEELAALQAKYAVPDEENAGITYNRLIEHYDYKAMHPDFLDREQQQLTLFEPWSSKDYPELAKWLNGNEGTIATLMQAAKIDTCRFPLNIDLVITDTYERNRYPTLRYGTFLLIRGANNDIAEGRIDKAMNKYICALRIGNHLCQQQKILDLSIGFYIENLALTQLNRFVIEGRPTAEQLQVISESFGNLQNNWSSDFSRGLEYDRLFWKNAFALFYEINNGGHIRISRNPAAVIRNLFFRRRLSRHFRDTKPHKAYAVLAWFFLPSTPHKTAEIIDTTMERYQAMVQPEYDWEKESTELRLHFKLNYRHVVKAVIMKDNDTDRYYRSFHDRYQRQMTLRRGSRLLAAIRQYQINHSAWPPDLDAIRAALLAEALIDPVTGKAFTYMNHGERFSLYGETANIWPR